MRRFGVPFLEKKGRGLLVYVLCCLAIFAGTMGLRAVYLKTGSFGLMLKMFLEYNHIPWAFTYYTRISASATAGRNGSAPPRWIPFPACSSAPWQQ